LLQPVIDEERGGPVPRQVSNRRCGEERARFVVERVLMVDGQRSWTVVDPEGIPVEPVDRFLVYLHGLCRSPNTIAAYAYDLRAFVEFLSDSRVDWREVDVERLARFVRWLEQPAGNVALLHDAEPARARATVARAVNAVHSFYDYQTTCGVPVGRRLASFSRVSKPHWRNGGRTAAVKRRAVKVKVPRLAPRLLDVEQVQALLAACRHQRDRFLLALLYETGMRVGQALGLRHEDFVSRERLVRIVPRADNANGARAKTDVEHELCVSGNVVRLYSDYMIDEYGSLDCDFVFVNLFAEPFGHPMTSSGVNELVRGLRARTGIDFTPHMLRHTHATELGRLGVPIEVISRRLTHANISTTMSTYIHLGVEDQRQALERAGFWPATKET
jgi:integrase